MVRRKIYRNGLREVIYILLTFIVLSIHFNYYKCFSIKDLENRELRKIGGLLKQLNKAKQPADPGVSNELIIPNLRLPRKVVWTPFRTLDHKHLYLDMNTELTYEPDLSKALEKYTHILATLSPKVDQSESNNPNILFV